MSSGSEQNTDHIVQRQLNLKALAEMGCDLYPHRFELTDTVRQLLEKHSARSGAELQEAQVKVKTAGRLVAIRGHGKASFGHLQGDGSRVQIYVRQDRVG